jgi:hypothetical protein
VSEYHWGDFKGSPNRLMERYYDAHKYVANWGTHRVMFRLPRDLLDLDVVEDYCVGDQVSAWTTDEFTLLELTSADHAGDLRPLYLAWLAAYGAWQRDEDVFDRDADDDLEPPVPLGLGALTAAQRAMADFLRLDDDLIAIAAHRSAGVGRTRGPLRHVRVAHHRLAANTCAQTQPHPTPQTGGRHQHRRPGLVTGQTRTRLRQSRLHRPPPISINTLTQADAPLWLCGSGVRCPAGPRRQAKFLLGGSAPFHSGPTRSGPA